MPLIVTSVSSSDRPGVYAYNRKPPATIRPLGTGICALVGQFDFGPPVSLYTPTSDADRDLTYGPPGMNRLTTGILATIQKAWPVLKIARVLGSSAVIASAIVQNATPANCVTFFAKYAGTGPNTAFSVTIAAASDGNANHFNATVTSTGASGTRSETFTNLNVSGTGADYLGADQLTSSRLVGNITKLVAGVPGVQTVAFSSGTNGSISASDYVGTAGNGDKGLALLEGDGTIRHACTDDPGNSLRSAVNAGISAHGILRGDRMMYINGPSGNAAAAAITDVASYRSINNRYIAPWAYELDDTTSAKQLVPSAPFAMSVAAQLPPSLQIAWRDGSVISMLNGISDVELNYGQSAQQCTAAGIVTLQKNPVATAGGFCFESDVTTNAPVDPTTSMATRTQMGIYVVTAIQASIQSFVNGPNVPLSQQSIVNAIDDFMLGLLNNKTSNPYAAPYVLAYRIDALSSVNSPTDQANGNFTVPIDFQTDAGMQRIYLGVQYGPTVIITATSTPTGV